MAGITITNLNFGVRLVSFKFNVHVSILRYIIAVDFQRGSREIWRSKLANINARWFLFIRYIHLILCRQVALLFLGDDKRVRCWISYLWHLILKIIL